MEHECDPLVQDETFGCSSCQYRYNYNDHIAKGAFGTVFQATITTRGDFIGAEQVAVKVTHLDRQSELLTDRKKWSKLRQRLENLPELSHDHLVKYHKITIAKGSRGGTSIELLMDYYTGEDLRSVIRNLRQQGALLSEADAVSYIVQIAEGLQFLHRNQLIHGDLKPCNILTTQFQNRSRKLAICDLDDIVQMDQDGTCSRDITNLRGTYRFMSPEMLRKFIAMQESENPGRKTDMWSLGCIMLELADCVVGNDQKWLRKGKKTIEVGDEVTDERFIHLIVDGYVPCAMEAVPLQLKANLQQCLHTASSERISASLLIQRLKPPVPIQQLITKECVALFRTDIIGNYEWYRFDPSVQTATRLILPVDLRGDVPKPVLGISNGTVLWQRKAAGKGVRSRTETVEVLGCDVQKKTSPEIFFYSLQLLRCPVTVKDKIYFWSYAKSGSMEFRTLDPRDGTNKILKPPLKNSALRKFILYGARDGERIIFIADKWAKVHWATKLWAKKHPPSMGVKCFDTVTSEWDWEYLPDLPGSRYDFAMVVLQDTVYVLGGYDTVTKSRSRSCLRLKLHSQTPQWEKMCDLLEERVDHCAFVSDNKIYVAGGLEKKATPSTVIEVYDTKRDLWLPVTVVGSSGFFDDSTRWWVVGDLSLSWPPCATEAVPLRLKASLQQCLHTTSSERISASSFIQQLKPKELVMLFHSTDSDERCQCYVFDPSTQTVTELASPMDLMEISFDNLLAVSNGSVLYQRPRVRGVLPSAKMEDVEILKWDFQKRTPPTALFLNPHRLRHPVTVIDKIYYWSSDEFGQLQFRTLDLSYGTNKMFTQPPKRFLGKGPRHAARDGKRIIFIEQTWSGMPSTRVLCFDTVTGEWESLPDLPGCRHSFAMVVLHKTVYVLGGYDDVTSRSCLRLDLQSPTRQWEPMRDLLEERRGHCAFVSDNMIYAVGGLGYWEATASSIIMEAYDAERDLWSAVSVSGSSRFLDWKYRWFKAFDISLSWPVPALHSELTAV